MASPLKSKHGWIAITAYAVLHDNICDEGETLSEGFWRATKYLAWPGWILLTSHLFFRTPLPLRFVKVR